MSRKCWWGQLQFGVFGKSWDMQYGLCHDTIQVPGANLCSIQHRATSHDSFPVRFAVCSAYIVKLERGYIPCGQVRACEASFFCFSSRNSFLTCLSLAQSSLRIPSSLVLSLAQCDTPECISGGDAKVPPSSRLFRLSNYETPACKSNHKDHKLL